MKMKKTSNYDILANTCLLTRFTFPEGLNLHNAGVRNSNPTCKYLFKFCP